MNSEKLMLIGQERSGKTNAAMLYADLYAKNKGAVIAYNVGKPEDFPDNEYEEIEPIGFYHELRFQVYGKEIRGAMRRIEHFFYKGRVHHFSTFSQLFHRKKVKIYRMADGLEENALATALFRFVSNALWVIDDGRSIFCDGLKKGHIDILSRTNHCGRENAVTSFRGKGMDIITVWHSAEHPNRDFWTYSTKMLLFRFPVLPDFSKLNNPLLRGYIEKAKEILDNAAPYQYYQLNIQGDVKGKLLPPLPEHKTI